MRRPERSREPYPRSSKIWNLTPLPGATTGSDVVGSLTPLPRDNWTRNTLQGDNEACGSGGATGQPAPSGDVRQTPNIWSSQTVVVPSKQGGQVYDQAIRTPWKLWEMEKRANEDNHKETTQASALGSRTSSSNSSNQSAPGWKAARSQHTERIARIVASSIP